MSIYSQRKLLWDSSKTIAENADFMAMSYSACATMKIRMKLVCVNDPRYGNQYVKPLWKDGYEKHPIGKGLLECVEGEMK